MRIRFLGRKAFFMGIRSRKSAVRKANRTRQCRFEPLEDRRLLAGETGLRADYFAEGAVTFFDTSLRVKTVPVLSRVDETINFSWGTSSPAVGTVPVDNFAVRWSGQIMAPTSGTYSFRTSSDDGVRLWINGQRLVNQWNNGSASSTGQIVLQQGQRYDIRLDYFEGLGNASAKLEWRTPGQSVFRIVPKEQLYPFSKRLDIVGGGLYVGSWESTDPRQNAVRVDSNQPVAIARSWIRGNSAMGTNADNGLIVGGAFDTQLTVRDTHLQGFRTYVPGTQQANAVNILNPKKFTFQNNYIEGTTGVRLLNFNNHPVAESITITRNQAKNIDGRREGTDGELIPWQERRLLGESEFERGSFGGSFVTLNGLVSQPNTSISWNEIVNQPFTSGTEDIFSFYQSGGTANNPMLVHNNYVQGGYSASPDRSGTSIEGGYEYLWTHTGSGINLGDNQGGVDVGYVNAYSNQVIDTSNAGILFAGGHDIQVFQNRVISAGLLPDGSLNQSNFTGILGWDFYGFGETKFYSNVVRNNTVGWNSELSGGLMRNDLEFRTPGFNGTEPNPLNPTNPVQGVTTSNNSFLPQPLTKATENAERVIWNGKLARSNVTVGVRSAIQYGLGTRIQAENYNQMSGVLNFQRGIGFLDAGDWIRLRNVNLGDGANQWQISGATTQNGVQVQLRLGSPTGALLGTISFSSTGSFSTMLTRSGTLSGVTGVRDLYLVFSDPLNIDYIQFNAVPSSTALALNSTASPSPAIGSPDPMEQAIELFAEDVTKRKQSSRPNRG